MADVRIRRGGRNQDLTGVLLLRAPASLRFEALSPFGPPVFLVASDADSMTLWEVLKDRAFILPASPEATQRWLGLPLGAEELVALLSGHVRPMKDPEEVELARVDADGASLTLRRGGATQRVWLDPASGLVSQAEWTGGKRPLRVEFAERSPEHPPAGLTLATLDGTLEVQVRYRRPQLDSGFDPALFPIRVPDTVKIQDFR
jgi:outer membrane lipoprotein-sorting protein